MALVRVYLFTYKRNHLLERAVTSLINQSFKDWVCELHNDAPEDHFPSNYINTLNEPRIKVINHEKNLGATASFNLAFNSVDEKYISILEDDNWWESEFLETMVQEMEIKPEVYLAWCKLKGWKELNDGTWKDTGGYTWESTFENVIFYKLQDSQIHSNLHSNGAMLLRTTNIENYKIPNSTWFDCIESIRERAFDYPIMLISKPLANYSMTIQTSRENKKAVWNAWQVLLIGSFFINVNWSKEKYESFFNDLNSKKLKVVQHYILVFYYYPKLIYLIKYFNIKLIIWGILYHIKNFKDLFNTHSLLKDKNELKNYLDTKTKGLVYKYPEINS